MTIALNSHVLRRLRRTIKYYLLTVRHPLSQLYLPIASQASAPLGLPSHIARLSIRSIKCRRTVIMTRSVVRRALGLVRQHLLQRFAEFFS